MLVICVLVVCNLIVTSSIKLILLSDCRLQVFNLNLLTLIHYIGCANKKESLGKLLHVYLRDFSRFFHEIYSFYRGRFRPSEQVIKLRLWHKCTRWSGCRLYGVQYWNAIRDFLTNMAKLKTASLTIWIPVASHTFARGIHW